MYSPFGGGHCRDGCHQTFANDASASAHRVGPYEPREARRCLTVEEMLAGRWPERNPNSRPRPFRPTVRGWNINEEMSAEQLARRIGA